MNPKDASSQQKRDDKTINMNSKDSSPQQKRDDKTSKTNSKDSSPHPERDKKTTITANNKSSNGESGPLKRKSPDTVEEDDKHNKQQYACRFFLRGLQKGRCLAGLNCKDVHATNDGNCIRCYSQVQQSTMQSHIREGCCRSILPSGLQASG